MTPLFGGLSSYSTYGTQTIDQGLEKIEEEDGDREGNQDIPQHKPDHAR